MLFMNKDDFKPVLKRFLTDMVSEWFDDKPLLKTLGNSLISANINKYDNIFEMFSDEHGDIDVEGMLNNLTDNMKEPIKIDLQQLSPLLPNRILLISKDDIKQLISSTHEKQIHMESSC